ncbi:Clp protease ClpP [Hymenobacter wooponensis]|uniref:Clp protease ClpP n=1 Tax=Hymenobacter wooponensis TaxID=1525360 RepID=A0A4Z0MST6_9BACT|nr:Clp protease ClpP [Hymenobacter wooponensis]TGD82872.1 Clp protease ClpP [Hymenobacter wooponensis]
MPELVIPVPENIGPGGIDWDFFEWIPSFTVEDIRMHLQYAEYEGIEVDSILLQFGICYGGSVRHALEIYNYLRGLGLPIRAHVLSITASSGTIVALAADEIEMEHTAQWMVHRPLYPSGTYSQRAEDLRADADRIDRDEQAIVDVYVAASGKSEQEVRQLVSVDRFMTAAEALDFGFVTKVNPLKSKAPTKVEAQAKLKHFKLAVARADKRTVHALNTPKPKAAASRPAANASPKPMAKNATPAAAKTAAKKVTPLTAEQKANAKIVADLAKKLGVKATIDGAADTTEVTAEATATVLADGAGTLYTDGPLAQGKEVFNDEALSVATADATYEAEDGREIVVAGGVAESVSDASDEGEAPTEAAATTTEAITAAVTAAIAPLTQRLDTMEAKFNKTVPPTPRPSARASAAPQVDTKNSNTPRPKAAHHAGL